MEKGDQRDTRLPFTRTNRRVGYHYVFTSLTHCGFATVFFKIIGEQALALRRHSPVIFVYVIEGIFNIAASTYILVNLTFQNFCFSEFHQTMTGITGILRWDIFVVYIVLCVIFVCFCCMSILLMFYCCPAKEAGQPLLMTTTASVAFTETSTRSTRSTRR